MNKNLFMRVALLCGLVAMQGTYGNAGTATDASPEARTKVQQFMQGDSVFIENAGQWPDTSIKFALDSRGANVGLTDHGPRFQLFRTKPGLTPAERSRDGSVPVLSEPGSETGLSPAETGLSRFCLVTEEGSTHKWAY